MKSEKIKDLERMILEQKEKIEELEVGTHPFCFLWVSYFSLSSPLSSGATKVR